MSNQQGNKKESTDLDRILKDEIFENVVVLTKLSSNSQIY